MNISANRKDIEDAVNNLLDTVTYSITAEQELEMLEWLKQIIEKRQEAVE